MKNLSILALTATLVIAPAFAETTAITTANNNVAMPTTTEMLIATEAEASTQDLSFAFDNTENLQAVAMTDEQMVDTQGALVKAAGGGKVAQIWRANTMSVNVGVNSYSRGKGW